MIRVLQMIGSLEIGGSQTMIMNLYRNINREEIQFDFIIDHSEQNFFAEEIKKLGGKIYVFPSFNGKNYFEIKKVWSSFFLAHREYKILHSHVRSYASLFLPIAKKNGVKTIIHSHSTSNGKGIKALGKVFLQYPLRYQADFFFACSRQSGKWLFGDKIIKSNKFYIIKNSINTKNYKYNEIIRKRYREQLNILDKTVLIHVGRLHPSKNHDFLLKVFKEYLQINKEGYLLIVGDGELHASIKTKIRQLDIENKVNLLGNRNDIAELFQAADILVFPSKWEGLPITVVEAQASGLPCVISEQITKEVAISELVCYLPINQGVEIWCNKIDDVKMIRKNVISKIKEYGFAIEENVEWITNFYRGLINE